MNVSSDSTLSKQNTTLSILSLNANDLRNKLNELSVISTLHNPDVICITETFGSARYSDSFFHLPNYCLFRQDRLSHGRGGIIIYVHEQVSCQVVSSVAHPSRLWEARTCKSFSHVRSVVPLQVTCMYRTPGNIPSSSLTEFINYFSISSKPNNDFHSITLGDFNFPKINWALNLCTHSIDSPAHPFLSVISNNHLSQPDSVLVKPPAPVFSTL